MNGLSKFVRDLRRRRVFRTAVLYIVAAWVVLQVADLAFPGLNIPEGAIRYVWIGALLGFPLALLFGWRYEITSRGIARTPPLQAGETADLFTTKIAPSSAPNAINSHLVNVVCCLFKFVYEY